MLAVDEDPASLTAQEGDGVAHHGQVLLERRVQRVGDVPHRRLGHERHDGGARVEQGAYLRVVLHLHAGLAGRAEGHQHRVLQRELAVGRASEELGVLGHRTRPAALDEADAQVVQVPRDGELVGHGVGDPLALGSVAQRGVEDVEGVGLHRSSLLVVGPDEARIKQKTPREIAEGLRTGWWGYRRATR